MDTKTRFPDFKGQNPMAATADGELPATRKVFIDLLGYEMNSTQIVVEVPADWDDAAIAQLSGRELAWSGGDYWDIDGEGGVVVLDEIRIDSAAPSDVEPDVVLRGDPPKQKAVPSDGVTFRSVREMLDLLDSFDGWGMISTDECLQVEAIRERYGHLLVDD